jgi:hypothetical protein
MWHRGRGRATGLEGAAKVGPRRCVPRSFLLVAAHYERSIPHRQRSRYSSESGDTRPPNLSACVILGFTPSHRWGDGRELRALIETSAA